MAETIPRSSRTEDAPPQNLSSSYLALIRVPSGPTPSPNICKGGISDGCFQNIVELFAKRLVDTGSSPLLKANPFFPRYITTFDKDRLALEGAYLPESTFSCRYIPISRSPPPDYLSKCNIGILQGHSPIIQAISSFSQRIVFAPPRKPTSNITIDALQLPGLSYFITMVFDTIIEDVDVSVDMIFLLKESARLTGKRDLLRVLWSPFVVISHQIILRS